MTAAGGVRQAAEKDVRRVWEIRNSPLVRDMSMNSDEISLDSHTRWFTEKYFVQTGNHCFLWDLEGEVIGYCRFDLQDGIYIISIAMDSAFQGRGLGDKLMKAAIAELGPGHEILAEVQRRNAASLRLFEKNGFKVSREDDRNFYLTLAT